MDNDLPPEISISTASNEIEEGQIAQFTINSNADSNVDLPIQVRVRKLINNFLVSETLETISIPAFESSTTLSVPTIDNNVVESTVEIIAEIQPNPAYSIASNESSTSISILDNETQPLVAIEAVTASVVEGDIAEFKLKISPVSINTFEVGVLLAATGGDFLDLAPIDSVTIVSYTDEKIFSVPTLNDDTSAEDGEITAEIQVGSNYLINDSKNSAAVTIVANDDFPRVSITALESSISEGEPVTIELSLSTISYKNYSVNIDINDGRFNLIDDNASWIVEIPANATKTRVVIPTIDDEEFVGDGLIKAESLTVKIIALRWHQQIWRLWK